MPACQEIDGFTIDRRFGFKKLDTSKIDRSIGFPRLRYCEFCRKTFAPERLISFRTHKCPAMKKHLAIVRLLQAEHCPESPPADE